MIYMMQVVEGHGCTINSVFTMRIEIIPKHFGVDTVSLVNLLFTQRDSKADYTKNGNLVEK